MIDFVGLLLLLVLVVVFGYLFKRSWGSNKKILKWVGLVLSGLLTLILAAAFVLAILGTIKLNQNYNADHPVVAVQVATTPEQVARAGKFANFCAGCHGQNGQLPLSGTDFAAGFPFPVGTLYARNLTPAGEIGSWSDGEVIRAIREGVHKSGRSLIIMPAEVFRNLSDSDVQAIVEYLRSQAPISPDAPANNLNVIGAIVVNLFPVQTVQPHITQPVVAPAPGATADYGKYFASILCIACHGDNLAGSRGGGGPSAPNLTAVVPKWSEADFVKLIRTGTLPDGKQIGDGMPWKEISAVATDDDLKGLYAYLHGLTPLPNNSQ